MMRKHSSYEALRTSLIIELDSYYQENGVYPNSLADLTDIEYSDGATPDMLKAFHYESNGGSYKLLYYSSYYGKEVEVMR